MPRETNLELQKISDTCKILGLDSYDPVKFIEIIRSVYYDALDLEVSINNNIHSEAFMGDRQVFFWKAIVSRMKDDLGRILLQFDKQTAEEIVEDEINARNLSSS